MSNLSVNPLDKIQTLPHKGFVICLPQVQKHHLSFKPSSSEHRVHFCERSLVRHPAVHSLCHQQDAVPPPQGDNPGRRQQQ